MRFQIKRTTRGMSIVDKRKRSNEQRLRAVEEKREQLKARSLSINVSSSTAGSAQHLLFHSDSEGSSAEDGIEHEQKLELFGESESEEEEIRLAAKFEGGDGERLFQLQQKIGHDKRFRVDERFLEGEGEGLVEDKGQAEPEDELAQQILQEKTKALKIIGSLLGSGALKQSDGERSLPMHVHGSKRRLLPARYDPQSSTSAELELDSGSESASERESSMSEEERGAPTDDNDKTVLPSSPLGLVHTPSSERYYNVSEDIKDMFNSQEHFSFLAQDGTELDNEEESLASEVLPHPTAISSPPNWIKTVTKLSSTKDKDGRAESDMAKQEDSDFTVPSCDKGMTFFFHSCSPNLCNRLKENHFYRSQSLSELEEEWPLRRAAMKQSFRKRRKDAIKLARKERKRFFK